MHAETVAGYRTEGGSRKKACVSVAVGMARDAQSIIIIHKLNKLKLQYYYWHARLGDARDARGRGKHGESAGNTMTCRALSPLYAVNFKVVRTGWRVLGFGFWV